MSQNAKTAQRARTKARERALDTDRAACDSPIETAAAAVLLGLDELVAAKVAVGQVEDIGEALRRLLVEKLTLAESAELCELTVSEVRKLSRRPLQGTGNGPAG